MILLLCNQLQWANTGAFLITTVNNLHSSATFQIAADSS